MKFWVDTKDDEPNRSRDNAALGLKKHTIGQKNKTEDNSPRAESNSVKGKGEKAHKAKTESISEKNTSGIKTSIPLVKETENARNTISVPKGKKEILSDFASKGAPINSKLPSKSNKAVVPNEKLNLSNHEPQENVGENSNETDPVSHEVLEERKKVEQNKGVGELKRETKTNSKRESDNKANHSTHKPKKKENDIEKLGSIVVEQKQLDLDFLGSFNLQPEGSQMKVLVRVRPMNKLENELRANSNPTVQVNNDSKSVQIYNTDGKITVMGFNHVYNDNTSQDSLFEASGVKDLVLQAMTGYATTIFAFGQTGSGKTFTITGPLEVSPNPETVGIVPRALSFLFSELGKQKSQGKFTDMRIQASYLEIYNENVLDLLNPQNSGLPVRWSHDRGFFVENLIVVDCDSLDDCLAVLEEGLKNRTTGAHASNEHSSRSHSVLTIYLEIQGYGESENMKHRYGKVTFVDLAGTIS
jgi:hypothetical protein